MIIILAEEKQGEKSLLFVYTLRLMRKNQFMLDKILKFVYNIAKNEKNSQNNEKIRETIIMLLQFNFRNYRSFRYDTSLDLTATAMNEFKYHIVNFGSEKVLPVAGIFGPNASGKSNALQAFEFMRYYVLQSIMHGNRPDEPGGFWAMPFLFTTDDTIGSGSSFEVFITLGDEGKVYGYGFEMHGMEVAEEWLYSTLKTSNEPKLIFRRKGRNIESNLSREQTAVLNQTFNSKILLLSLGAQLNIGILQDIWQWFNGCEIVNYGNPLNAQRMSKMLPAGFAKDKLVRNKVVKFFASFDDSIRDFEVTETTGKVENSKEYRVDAVHEHNGVRYAMPLRYESEGTLKMFSLFDPISKVLKTGGVLFVDELEAKLHPLLVRMIVNTFVDSKFNPNHAQLVFTSHQPWLLDCNALRRDEIWFTQKEKSGNTTLYSLAEFTDKNGAKIRKDENFAKNYLLGKYGAIPNLKNFNFLQVTENGKV